MLRSHLLRFIAPVAMLGVASGVKVLTAQDTTPVGARPTVAVMYFDNGSLLRDADYSALSKGIADLLITDLTSNTSIRVVEREALQKLLEEQNLGSTQRVDPSTAVRIGKILGAQHMVFGTFVIDPKREMVLAARAVNVETSQVEYVEKVTGKSDEMLKLISDLATKMNQGMHLAAMPDLIRPAYDMRPSPGRFEALRLYSRALVEQDQGHAPQAIAFYQQALSKFPEFQPAQQGLKRLQLAVANPTSP